mmetsp:Transcript_8219/g.21539  ORF Transcript_8219/g.21539 Transcript_8219/m.21539 type:complete len:206 (-) Transcript_8219:141-758(-)
MLSSSSFRIASCTMTLPHSYRYCARPSPPSPPPCRRASSTASRGTLPPSGCSTRLHCRWARRARESLPSRRSVITHTTRWACSPSSTSFAPSPARPTWSHGASASPAGRRWAASPTGAPRRPRSSSSARMPLSSSARGWPQSLAAARREAEGHRRTGDRTYSLRPGRGPGPPLLAHERERPPQPAVLEHRSHGGGHTRRVCVLQY